MGVSAKQSRQLKSSGAPGGMKGATTKPHAGALTPGFGKRLPFFSLSPSVKGAQWASMRTGASMVRTGQ
eukprot:361603-Chlamydomonas_euryale.AAC.3